MLSTAHIDINKSLVSGPEIQNSCWRQAPMSRYLEPLQLKAERVTGS